MSISDLLRLSFMSLWHRRFSAVLTILAVAFAVMLFLGIDKTRKATYESFENTISGTQLIVGARTTPEALVMASVFNIGNMSANMSTESLEWVASNPSVEWTVPISTGDNYRGYRVLGTTDEYFKHIQYRGNESLSFSEGRAFDELFEVVLGAAIVSEYGYTLGDDIVLSHGHGDDFSGGHDNLPFTIVGILERTGTPIDETLLISLNAMDAIHFGWESGARSPIVGMIDADDFVVAEDDHAEHDHHEVHEDHEDHSEDVHNHEEHDHADAYESDLLHNEEEHSDHSDHGDDHEGHVHTLDPDSVSAVYVGLTGNNPFIIKRQIDTYTEEALVAAVPSLALQNIWNAIGIAENALLLVSGFVVIVGLVSIMTSIMTSVRERRREMAVLRSIGAGPGNILSLICSEAFLLAFIGTLVGIVATYMAFLIAAPFVENAFSIALGGVQPGREDLALIVLLPVIAGLLGLIPGIQAMRNSLADGLSIKL